MSPVGTGGTLVMTRCATPAAEAFSATGASDRVAAGMPGYAFSAGVLSSRGSKP